jgi:two-component system chemotaxis response regulator CheB
MADTVEAENRIARYDQVPRGEVLGLGPLSTIVCPQCHGVMVQIREGSILRFRCHTGHAFSMQSLLSGVSEAIDENLSKTMRTIDEYIFLLREMAKVASNEQDAALYLQQARQAEKRNEQLRELLVAPHDLGHDLADT